MKGDSPERNSYHSFPIMLQRAVLSSSTADFALRGMRVLLFFILLIIPSKSHVCSRYPVVPDEIHEIWPSGKYNIFALYRKHPNPRTLSYGSIFLRDASLPSYQKIQTTTNREQNKSKQNKQQITKQHSPPFPKETLSQSEPLLSYILFHFL